MTGRRVVIITLLMFLISGWSTGVTSEIIPSYSDESNSVSDEQTYGKFQPFSNVHSGDFDLRSTTGLIHSPYGSFDPLIHPMPLGPETVYDVNSLERTRFAIVQSDSANLNFLKKDLEEVGMIVIETIPDNTFLIRVPMQFNVERTLDDLGQISGVRWVGELPIGWRISPDLSAIAGRESIIVDLEITPSPDISNQELFDLQSNLASISTKHNERDICDAHLCQVKSINAIWIPILAMDGRILHIHSASKILIHNSVARDISGINQAVINSGNILNGSGEVIAISDTGLDSDHGDFDGRIRGIYNQFGPDNSAQDTNSGHGTHVTATLLGDGTGDSNALGMVPAATFHFYQLEVDSSGILARWGSLYEMFTHAWDNSARIQTNSWGNENLVGEYSSDSRSADAFIVDNPRFLVLFSSGDLGEDGSNTVTPPGSSKNVLTVGASTTGAQGTETIGNVPSFSSVGATLDGRIKPDLVAPGVMICSARAEEANSPQGESCSASTHSDGSTPLYMALNGSSMATAVAAGGAAMIRQHLRTDSGINEPRSDLIKAIMINGADDLGSPDIPNPSEGWGQINIENSISPTDDGTDLDLLFDDSRTLNPSHSFMYTISVDDTTEFDLTLAWVDSEASIIANQTARKLVNDLDLIATSPDGTQYHGNVFSNGYSISGGLPDRLNNIERIKIPSGNGGVWTISVGHAGGNTQSFALVATGILEEDFASDLTVIEGSLSTSVLAPLQGDTVLVEAVWRNQAAENTGAYVVEIEDLTEGQILFSQEMPSMGGGETKSLSFPHVFQTTGAHVLELRLDTLNSVEELNDEDNGINNNIFQLTVEISQIGVRITPLLEDGTLPTTPSQLEDALTKTLDPREGSVLSYEFMLQNEGTSAISVGLTVTPLQAIDENGILQSPNDEWWKLLNETGPWDLAALGEDGDHRIVTLTLEDVDADINDPTGARYALPGNFVNDLILFDRDSPTVSHKIRITSVVERVEGLLTILAGTGNDLGAKPGDFATFSLSIKNIGNGDTQYSVSCTSPNQWLIDIAGSGSSSLILDPLSRLQFLPLPISVRVPDVAGGQPAAGVSEDVTCVTTSVQDSTITKSDMATVTVFESLDFSVDLFDDENNVLGALAIADDRPVLNGNLSKTRVIVTNEGNVPMDFTMSVSSSLSSWQVELVDEEQRTSGDLLFSVNAGELATITIELLVPQNAEMNTRNTLTLMTSLFDGDVEVNGTRFIVQEIATIETSENGIIQLPLGQIGTGELRIKNSGNVPLSTTWSIGSLPLGWVGGFQSIVPATLDMNREANVIVGVEVSGNIPVGMTDVTIPVIVEAVTPGLEIITHTFEFSVEITPSIFVSLSTESPVLRDINPSTFETFTISVSNLGNQNSGFTLEASPLENWEIEILTPIIESIEVGETVEITIKVSPKKSATPGLSSFVVWANSTDQGEINTLTNSEIDLQVSRLRQDTCSGVGCLIESTGLPSWTLAVIFLLILTFISVTLVRMRKQSLLVMSPDEDLIPIGSALNSGSQTERRAMALETGSAGEVISKSVTSDEISDVISSSAPTLPPPVPVPPGAMPLPPGGLPEGWTMDQWVAYGHLWYEQNT